MQHPSYKLGAAGARSTIYMHESVLPCAQAMLSKEIDIPDPIVTTHTYDPHLRRICVLFFTVNCETTVSLQRFASDNFVHGKYMFVYLVVRI